MKNIKLLSIIFCSLALTGCRDTKTPHDRLEDIDDSKVESTKMPNGYDRDTIDSAPNDRLDTLSNEERTAMYRQLNMTPEQIDAYEGMERAFINQATKNTGRSQTLSDVEKRRAQYLSDILNNEQYKMYEKWREKQQDRNKLRKDNPE